MKRTKPAATSPSHTVPPETKSPSLPEQTSKGQLPSPPASQSEADDKTNAGPASGAIPLGLATTEPISRSTARPETPAGPPPEPKPRPGVERSSIPAILLEGDEPKPEPKAELAQKFTTASQPERALAGAAQAQLPESYGTGRLLLTARDPNCLYAHWDLSSEQQQRHLNLSAQGQLQLRIHQDSLSGPVISEVPVGRQAHHSFVPVGAPGAKRFVGELGYYSAEGPWRTVAAADTAAAAPAVPSGSEPPRFATLSFGSRESVPGKPQIPPAPAIAKPGGVAVQGQGASRSFPLPRPLAAAKVWAKSLKSGEVVNAEESQNWQEFPLDQESPAVFGDLFEDEYQAEPGQVFARLAAPWSDLQERALAELIGWNAIRSESFGSGGIEELIRRSERVGLPGELSSIGLASQAPPLSSAGIGGLPAPQPQGFWFNVNAELVIYGATQPDAAVTIGGRPIALRPDGTFSYRFALPDGNYQLPLIAHSPQGEQRAATLDFYRGTAYSGGAGAQPPSPELKLPTVENVA